MKMVQRSRKPSFAGQSAEVGAINQHKAMAMGKQGAVSPTKNPGSKSGIGRVKVKSSY